MIVCRSLMKKYKIGAAVASLDLVIPDGQVVGILGRNGAGKTTLLKMMAGLMAPTTGDVFFDGRSPAAMTEDIAFITEAGSWFPGWCAWKHADFLQNFFPRFNRERYRQLLSFFSIPLDVRAGRLSTGEQARLELAIGFSKGARYLLLDEPFLGKDIFSRRDFLQMMAAGLKEDETILISTHLIDEIENFLDRAVVLNYGRIKADCMIDELRESGISLEQLMADACGYDQTRIQQYL